MARVPQEASADVQISIREINSELKELTSSLSRVKLLVPPTKAVDDLQSAVEQLSKKPTYLDTNDVFRASGPAHMHGYVPDPGVSVGTTKFLREDATWALASGGVPGAHTHPSQDITHVGSGYVLANDVKEAIEELDLEKLARSGAQDMLGDLDMGGNAIGDVENLTFTGGIGAAIIDQTRTIYMTGAGEITGVKLIDMAVSEVGEGLIDEVRRIDMNGIGRIDDIREGLYFETDIGEGIIDGPRVIHMVGDHVNDEAKIDGLERAVFNNEPTASSIEQPSRLEWNTGVLAASDYTPAEGKTSWDTLEDTMIVWVASGVEVVPVDFGWSVKLAVIPHTGGEF
jgi:hypothetical protein